MSKKRRVAKPANVDGKSRKIKPPPYPKLKWPEEIQVNRIIMPDGALSFGVNPNFVTMSCLYYPWELRERLADHVQWVLNKALKRAVDQDSEEHPVLIIDEEAWKAGVRDLDPTMQELINKYSDYAYNVFTRVLLTKMYQLPELLVEKIMYKIVFLLHKDNLMPFKVKSGARRMWEDLGKEEWKDVKEEWLDLKPGMKPVTSRQERAEMLAYYHAVRTTCQQAKRLYKETSSRRWKSTVKERFPILDDVIIDNLPDHKPSWLAELLTGRHFRKVIGKDFRGLPEVKRQLGIARQEARMENGDDE